MNVDFAAVVVVVVAVVVVVRAFPGVVEKARAAVAAVKARFGK